MSGRLCVRMWAGCWGGGHMSPDEFYAKQNVNTRAASVTAGGAPSYKSPWF